MFLLYSPTSRLPTSHIQAVLSPLLALIAVATMTLCLPIPAEAESTNIAQWESELSKIREHLEAGNFEEAQRGSKRLLGEFDRQLIAEPYATRLIGQTFAYRAIATMGQGEARLAAWDFSVAQSFDSEITAETVADLGSAGQELEEYLGPGGEFADSKEAADSFDPAACQDLQPPAPQNRKEPKVPHAILQGVQAEGEVTIVGVRIDAEGNPRTLSVLRAPSYPTMAVSFAESLRDTSFEPARCGGKAVATRYNMSTLMSAS